MLPDKAKKSKKVFNIILALIFTAAVAFSACYIIYYKHNKSLTANNQKKQEQANKQKEQAKNQQEERKKQQQQQQEQQEKQKQQLQAQMDAKYEEGKKLFLDGEYTKAIDIADELIKQDSNYYKAYNLKGIALCFYGSGFSGENFTKGTDNIKKALELKPDDWYCLFNMGLANELYAKYDDAIEWYNKSLQYNKYEWSYYGIASIYGRRGDVADTVKYLQLAIDIDSSGIKSKAKDEPDFNNVRSSQEFQNLIK